MEKLIVDERGIPFPAPDGTAVGWRGIVPGRLLWALPLLTSGLSRRYSSFAPGESSLFGMDFSFCLSPEAQVVSAALAVFTNTFAPTPALEWRVGPVMVRRSVVYAQLSGGLEGGDYRLRWTVTDSDGNVWPRTALVLVTATS